ncbi:hypothetical protein GT018_27705 [Streptomyces sp. SID4912]|nr:hypothetical protein [Streptomyces sp. SID4912]
MAAGYGISVGPPTLPHHRGDRPPGRPGPGLLKILREHEAEYVLLDGTLAECDRVGDARAGYSHKHRRHGVNVQVVSDPIGQVRPTAIQGVESG